MRPHAAPSLSHALALFFTHFSPPFLLRLLLPPSTSLVSRGEFLHPHTRRKCTCRCAVRSYDVRAGGGECLFIKTRYLSLRCLSISPLVSLSLSSLSATLSLSRTASLVVFLFLFSSSSSILSPSSASPLIFDPESKRGQRQACRSLRPYF